MTELFTPEALSALFQVIMIDLVLAGDNAIVIGLAAAGLPKEQRGLINQASGNNETMWVWSGSRSWQSGVRSKHPGGANIVMCDASVHFLNENIACNQGHIALANLQVFEELMAAGDGKVDPLASKQW